MPVWGLTIILAAIAVGAIVGLHFFTKRVQKKHDAQQEQIDSYKQTYSMLVIDKKKMRLTDAGFPDYVVQQMPRFSRLFKYPVVKAKVGPKVMTFITDKNVFEQIPVKKEMKADVSGLYITAVKSVRGGVSSSTVNKKKDSKFEQLLKKGRGEA
ncbi:MAG: hypothetical protein IKE31_05775 [Eubacterium sp.]|nr:hypothetical protein [Eubacterium sp.]